MKKKITNPLVSILIPVYNGSEFLDETLQSIFQNTYRNFEIILVDDGSTDTSRTKCRNYAKKYKNVFFYYFRKNKGMTRCLNFGIKKAKGKYIARINQDDLMTRTRLSKQVKFLQTHPNYVVVGGAIQLFTDKKEKFDTIYFPKTDKQIRSQWLMVSPYSDPTVMYRKNTWKKTEGYSQYFWPADDVHMWYQLGSIGKMANLNCILTKVRWHNDCGSIKSHKRQIIKTWAVHQWAAEMIKKPSVFEYFFGLMQLFAGLFFPAKFNWWVYRQLRKIQKTMYSNHFFNFRRDFLKRIKMTIPIVDKVAPQPTT